MLQLEGPSDVRMVANGDTHTDNSISDEAAGRPTRTVILVDSRIAPLFIGKSEGSSHLADRAADLLQVRFVICQWIDGGNVVGVTEHARVVCDHRRWPKRSLRSPSARVSMLAAASSTGWGASAARWLAIPSSTGWGASAAGWLAATPHSHSQHSIRREGTSRSSSALAPDGSEGRRSYRDDTEIVNVVIGIHLVKY